MLTSHTFARFFFSSRRRHTRWPRDWSSDVCSSDLSFQKAGQRAERARDANPGRDLGAAEGFRDRSEERRVGKECRSRRAPDHYKKKKDEGARAGENNHNMEIAFDECECKRE